MKKLLCALFFLSETIYCMENQNKQFNKLFLNIKAKTLWMALFLNAGECYAQHKNDDGCKSFFEDVFEMLNKCGTKADSKNQHLKDMKNIEGIKRTEVFVPFKKGINPDCMNFWQNQMVKHVKRCQQKSYLIEGDLCKNYDDFQLKSVDDYKKWADFYE